MASRKSRSGGSARKKSGASRKSTTAGRKTSSARKTTGARKKTTAARKKTTAARKKTTAARKKTTAARKKTTAAARKTVARRKSGTAKRGSTAKTKTAGRKRTGTSRKASAAKKTSASARKKTATRARKTATKRAPARQPLELRSLDDVLMQQLTDLYSTERQLVDALPKLAGAAGKPELQEAFRNHLEETRGHVTRLETVFRNLGGQRPRGESTAMQGLVQDGERVVQARGDDTAKDAALIAAAQRVEHYEIAAYGTARTLAGELGHSEARDLLDATLNEESNADTLLTKIATGGRFGSGVNDEAASNES